MSSLDTQLDDATKESPASLLALAALVFTTESLVAGLRFHTDVESSQRLEDVTVYHLGPPDSEY